ncbi:MAG TPA: hypothetical protein VK797_27130 [Tepidisphaeraceae bacterium]|jgi:hypothetical protein|nr:hypothetical protein [Tepidisphaeraceae bacterium]
MCEVGTNSKLTKRWLLVATLAGALGSATVLGQPAPAAAQGTYHILVRGFYNGEGTANVSGDQVTINANVRSDQGMATTLTATCSLTGDHFSGSTVLPGGSVTIQGRVEAQDPNAGKGNGSTVPNQDSIVHTPRIGATFLVSNGHGGRFSGTKVDIQ